MKRNQKFLVIWSSGSIMLSYLASFAYMALMSIYKGMPNPMSLQNRLFGFFACFIGLMLIGIAIDQRLPEK